MKNAAKLVFKGLLVIVLFTGSTIALSTVGVKSVSEANAAVSYQQVNQYLVDKGYEVITLELIDGKGPDWVACTIKDNIRYTTTVNVVDNEIVGHTDVPM